MPLPSPGQGAARVFSLVLCSTVLSFSFACRTPLIVLLFSFPALSSILFLCFVPLVRQGDLGHPSSELAATGLTPLLVPGKGRSGEMAWMAPSPPRAPAWTTTNRASLLTARRDPTARGLLLWRLPVVGMEVARAALRDCQWTGSGSGWHPRCWRIPSGLPLGRHPRHKCKGPNRNPTWTRTR